MVGKNCKLIFTHASGILIFIYSAVKPGLQERTWFMETEDLSGWLQLSLFLNHQVSGHAEALCSSLAG